jgi:glycosyl transferase family 25
VHTYVINLARSMDRRAHITGELERTGLGYEIVTAVDGRQIDIGDRSIVDPALLAAFEMPEGVASSALVAGSAGAALSHLHVYEKIIDQGRDYALVLEDDVNLPAEMEVLSEAVAQHLTGAELALLSYDNREPCRLSIQGAVDLPSGRVLALPIDIREPHSSGAYVITREACERLVKSIRPVRAQADAWWFYYREGVLDRVRCVTPMPVRKNATFSSTIGSYSVPSTGLRRKLTEQLLNHKIPVVHQALSYRRERIYRRSSRTDLVDVPFVERASRLD